MQLRRPVSVATALGLVAIVVAAGPLARVMPAFVPGGRLFKARRTGDSVCTQLAAAERGETGSAVAGSSLGFSDIKSETRWGRESGLASRTAVFANPAHRGGDLPGRSSSSRPFSAGRAPLRC